MARAVSVAHAHPDDELVAALRGVQLDQAVHTRLREANNLLLLGAKRTYLGGVGDGDSVRDIWAYQALFPSAQSARGANRRDRALALWR